MSGTITTGRFIITEESFGLNDLVDVEAETPSNNDVVIYKDNAVNSNFTTGWQSTKLTTGAIDGFSTDNPAHNDILAYNDNTLDATFETAWVPKNVSSIFTELESTVDSIVGISTAKLQSENGNPSKTDMVMFSATPAGSGETVSIGSNGSNNIISKKEPAESLFSFVQTLDRGQRVNLTFPIGTVFRSSKGLYGFSGPLPTPLGPQSFSLLQCQFYVSGAATLTVVSLGTEVNVTLFDSDQTTILSGPTMIIPYHTSTFSCPATGEYFVSSSGPICASVTEGGTKNRPLVPMTTEIITWNIGCLVTALEATTSVTYYRRNGNTGTITVSPGTPVALGAGNNTGFAIGGAVRIVSDKPISTYTVSDSIGDQVLSGFPVSQMSQLFSNPSFIDSTTSYARSAVAIASPFEGTATVYTSAGVIIDTFNYTRTIDVTTAADQLFPAAGRWRPEDVGAGVTFDGGFIQTNTPAVCYMNTSSDPVWNSNGEEYFVLGSTPEDIRADIKRDGSGILRRRDINNAGVVTWNIC